MGDDHIAKGQELAKKFENKLHACCPLLGSNFKDAAQLFHKSATSFKLTKSWDKAGSLFVKSAKCHLKLDSKYNAANAYGDAAHCYKKTSTSGVLEVNPFVESKGWFRKEMEDDDFT